jgi:hypothetical protein
MVAFGMGLAYTLIHMTPALSRKKMQTTYPLNVQAIRSQGKQPRLYVTFPLALAAAIGLNPGDRVQWELLDRGELHLIRLEPPPPTPRRQTRKNRPDE